MDKVQPKPVDWREARRFRGWELQKQGWKQKDIAAALGVTKGAVSQWVSRAAEEGVEGLRTRKPTGKPPRLSLEQRAELPRLLEQGAQAFGFRGELWTLPRVADLIRRQFGISYHPSHVGRILVRCGWSPQKPRKQAIQRDEEAIQRWREERWPSIKKRPRRRLGPWFL